MIRRFEWTVAVRFLQEGRMQTALIVAGVTAGVAIIIAITALITGLQSSLVERTLGTQAHIAVKPPEEEATPAIDRESTAVGARIEKRAQRLRSIDQWERIMPQLERMTAVVAVSPIVTGPAFAVRGTASRAIALVGVEPERYQRIVDIQGDMVEGVFRISGTNTVIGLDLARDLGVTVGDKIRIQTASNRGDTLSIVGLFDVGSRELNRRWVFLTLSSARNLLDLPGGVSQIDVKVADIFAADAVATAIEARMPVQAESWMRANAQLLAALRNQTATSLTIRVFVIIIVALGIASVLVVSVVQKSREIGILRAMGTSRGRIMTVFLIQGGIVGFAGAVLGSALGTGLLFALSRVVRDANGNSVFTPDVTADLFIVASLVAIGVGLAAAVAPARRAALLDPVAAIRAG
jgi:lipoprotein-releasing system permease protein